MAATELWGYIAGGIGMMIGVLGWLRNNQKDAADSAKSDATVLTELGYIKSGIDDVKRKQERQDESHLEVTSRLVKVEASAKSAHSRIDEHLRYDHHQAVEKREG